MKIPRVASIFLIRVLCIGLYAGSALAADTHPDNLRVTYIGNAGYLLESGGRKVLIDGLVADYHSQYVELSAATQHQLESAQSPFDEVDLVLATHFHHDHFGPQSVGRYLMSNQKAQFVSTPQAQGLLRSEFFGYDRLGSRLHAVYPEEGTTRSLAKLGVKALNLHHGRYRKPLVENLGFVMQMGDWNILHVGDTEITPAEFKSYAGSLGRIDVAMITTWFLEDNGWESVEQWKSVIEAAVNPRHIILIHLPPRWRTASSQISRRRWIADIQREYPETVVFGEALEARVFSSIN
jgi:L-ascorbate metabolism protein UlaG (beta-lactamase superfamily)